MEREIYITMSDESIGVEWSEDDGSRHGASAPIDKGAAHWILEMKNQGTPSDVMAPTLSYLLKGTWHAKMWSQGVPRHDT